MSEKETADPWTQQAKKNAEYLYKCGGQALSGLTIRDYFAAKALAGGVAFEQEDGCYRGAEEAAQLAYKIADAMLEARKS